MLCIVRDEFYKFDKEDTYINIGGLNYEVINLLETWCLNIIYPLSGLRVIVGNLDVIIKRIKGKDIRMLLRDKCPKRVDLYKKVNEIYDLVEEKNGKVKVRTIDDLDKLGGKIRDTMSYRSYAKEWIEKGGLNYKKFYEQLLLTMGNIEFSLEINGKKRLHSSDYVFKSVERGNKEITLAELKKHIGLNEETLNVILGVLYSWKKDVKKFSIRKYMIKDIIQFLNGYFKVNKKENVMNIYTSDKKVSIYKKNLKFRGNKYWKTCTSQNQ